MPASVLVYIDFKFCRVYFTVMRIWTISDIHVDFVENARWIADLSDWDFSGDVCLLAGDVSHDFALLQRTLLQMRRKFARLFFVPGNHDVWVRNEQWTDSLQKHEAILHFCRQNDIDVRPAILENAGKRILILPVFAWYHQAGQNDSLFLPKPGEDSTNRMWSDLYFIRWPDKVHDPVDFFLDQSNGLPSPAAFDFVISFSHFLPRRELMFSGPMVYDAQRMRKYDRFPRFNFSRVAGSLRIDRFIRRHESHIHIYGHQHINRDRTIENVRYIAHCLGYPDERKRGSVQGLEQGLKQITV